MKSLAIFFVLSLTVCALFFSPPVDGKQNNAPIILKTWWDAEPEKKFDGYYAKLYVQYDPAVQPKEIELKMNWENKNGTGSTVVGKRQLRFPSSGIAWHILKFKYPGEYKVVAVLKNESGEAEMDLPPIKF